MEAKWGNALQSTLLSWIWKRYIQKNHKQQQLEMEVHVLKYFLIESLVVLKSHHFSESALE